MNISREPEIFLSYCWNDRDEVDKIDNFFRNRSIVLKRDNRDIGDWKSIRLFMNSIRKTDYVVLVISDSYLKSSNCMYEILELMKEEEYCERIMPVVLEKGIYDPIKRVDYIRFWENRYDELRHKIKEINNIENTAEMTNELKRVKQISQTIGEFLSLVSDLNNPSIENINYAILKKIRGKHIITCERITGLDEFLRCLDCCKYIEIAFSPENPYEEQKHFLHKYEIDSDMHGLSIKFYMSSINSNEEVELIIPDIVKIEKNTLESSRHKKFYMYCIDRIAMNKYNDFIKLKEHGIEYDLQKEYELQNQTINAYRCIVWY